MILRLSQKLAKKIKLAPTGALPPDPNPFADWSGHLFTAQRAQYVILTNTASLYSVLLHGAGVSTAERLLDRGLSAIRDIMEDNGLSYFYAQFVAPSAATVQFSKSANRSVTGSMNDMIFHAKIWLIERELSPFDTARELNEIPMGALGYRHPSDVMRSLTPVAGR